MSDWKSKTFTIRVVNNLCGREDIHKNLTDDEVAWIRLDPNLYVEILEVSPARTSKRD